MKALIALNESTTAEIIADILNIPEEEAKGIAGQMRLSEILSLVQELKANNMWEANEIIKPYLAELKSGTGFTKTAAQNQSNSTNKSIGSNRQTMKGQNADADEEMRTGEPAGDINISMTDKEGNELYSKNVNKSSAMRSVRQLPKSAKGSAIRNIAGTA